MIYQASKKHKKMPMSGGSLYTNLGKTMETYIVNETHVHTIFQFCTASMKPAFTVVTSDPVYCSFTKDGPVCLGRRLPFLADVAYPFRGPSIGRNVGIGRRMRTFCLNETAFNSFSSSASYQSFLSSSPS